MPNSRIWIDPKGRAFGLFDQFKPKTRPKRASDSKTQGEDPAAPAPQALVKAGTRQVVTVQPPISTPPRVPEICLPAKYAPSDLTQLEDQLRRMSDTLDFAVPEGFLDGWFNRIDRRLQKKTERAHLIAEFQAAIVENLRQKRYLCEEARNIDQSRWQRYLDALIAWRTAVEEHYQAANVENDFARNEAVKNAKAAAQIAAYTEQVAACEGRARNWTREPVSPPPAPTPEEMAERRRQAAQRARKERIQMKLDECEGKAYGEQEKVGLARAMCCEIFQRLDFLKGEKVERICRVLETFNVDERILPEAIRELLAEEECDDD